MFSLSNYTFKFKEFMNGDKVFIHTKLSESTLTKDYAVALSKTYVEMINDSYSLNPETFEAKHFVCVPCNMEEFRFRCYLLLFDVIMSCSELLERERFLAVTIGKVSEALTVPEMLNIPVIICDNNGEWVERSSGCALDKMYNELMEFKKHKRDSDRSGHTSMYEVISDALNRPHSERPVTRTYKHANGSMTLRPLRT